jgi:hypothetical protein
MALEATLKLTSTRARTRLKTLSLQSLRSYKGLENADIAEIALKN